MVQSLWEGCTVLQTYYDTKNKCVKLKLQYIKKHNLLRLPIALVSSNLLEAQSR